MPAQFVATQQRAMAMRNARRARFLVAEIQAVCGYSDSNTK